MKRWNTGDEIVLRFRRNQPADVVFAVLVIEDNPDLLSVFLSEGTRYKGQATKDGRPLGREIPFLEREPLIAGVCDKTWYGTNVLMIQRPHEAFAVWLFWDAVDWSFTGYYVNLQASLVRTRVGFDTADLLLDIQVAPDLSWQWKDQDEFEEALDHGILTEGTASIARDAASHAIAEIEARRWPFDGSLLDWRPNPSWPIPLVPDKWSEDA
ncbi:MAG: DUF402 domain-containing protein [Thermomicrobiales bacterium]